MTLGDWKRRLAQFINSKPVGHPSRASAQLLLQRLQEYKPGDDTQRTALRMLATDLKNFEVAEKLPKYDPKKSTNLSVNINPREWQKRLSAFIQGFPKGHQSRIRAEKLLNTVNNFNFNGSDNGSAKLKLYNDLKKFENTEGLPVLPGSKKEVVYSPRVKEVQPAPLSGPTAGELAEEAFKNSRAKKYMKDKRMSTKPVETPSVPNTGSQSPSNKSSMVKPGHKSFMRGYNSKV